MLEAIEFVAVIASGTYGILLARRKRMDFVGVFTVASMIAFGGGTLRDLFLDRHPLFWIENGHYPVIVFVMALVTGFLKRLPGLVEKMLPYPDALGLGLFSIVGAGFAMEAGTPLFVAALLGVVTGTFGGVMGDVLCNEIPSLFRSGVPLYATCSFAGSWMYILLFEFTGAGETVALGCGIAVVVLSRLAALRWHLNLPEHAQPEERADDGGDQEQL